MNGYARKGFTFYNLDYGLYGGVFVRKKGEIVLLWIHLLIEFSDSGRQGGFFVEK